MALRDLSFGFCPPDPTPFPDPQPSTPPLSCDESFASWRLKQHDFFDASSSESGAPASALSHDCCILNREEWTDQDAERRSDKEENGASSSLSIEEGALLLLEFRESLLNCDGFNSCYRANNEAKANIDINMDIDMDLSNMNPLLRTLHRILSEQSSKGLSVSQLGLELINSSGKGSEPVPRSAKLARLMRNSPYFAELEDGNFTLWTKILAEDSKVKVKEDVMIEELKEREVMGKEELGVSARVNVLKQEREISGRIKAETLADPGRIGVEEVLFRPKRAKIEKRIEGEIIQCKRKSGKGWQCREIAREGYVWCEYHLMKRRHNNLAVKMKKMNAAAGTSPILNNLFDM